MKTIPDKSIDLVLTSPPYNKCARQQNNTKAVTWSKGRIKYDSYNDCKPQGEYEEWQKVIIRECVRLLKPEGSMFYNHKQQIREHKVIFPHRWLEEFNIRQMIVWNRKNSPMLEPIRFLPCTEYLFWITKERKTPYFNPKCFSYSEVWEISPKPMKEHPAPFPIELATRVLTAASNKDFVVLDPFMGSGTTGVACKELGRNFIGIEISPEYYKIAERRINQTSENLL
jgi:modification methylase